MPERLSVPCLVCGSPTRCGSRCPAHARPSRWPKSGAYDHAWRRLRDSFIAEHPRCEWPGCSSPADEVDHVVSVRVDPSRRLDPTNLRSLCRPHHRAVTARASNGGVVAAPSLTRRAPVTSSRFGEVRGSRHGR
jgi:5-methylcytosine-specific restriction endonuclease McrA